MVAITIVCYKYGMLLGSETSYRNTIGTDVVVLNNNDDETSYEITAIT